MRFKIFAVRNWEIVRWKKDEREQSIWNDHFLVFKEFGFLQDTNNE